MILKVNGLVLTGTVDEIVEFLEKYDVGKNQVTISPCVWDSNVKSNTLNDSKLAENYKKVIESFEQDK